MLYYIDYLLKNVFTELIISTIGVVMYSRIKEVMNIIDSLIAKEDLDENTRKNLLTSKKLLVEVLDDLLCLRGCLRELNFIFSETMKTLNMEKGGGDFAFEVLRDSMYSELNFKWKNDKRIIKIENVIG